MLDVCLGVGCRRTDRHLPHRDRTKPGPSPPYSLLTNGPGEAQDPAAEYQNMVRNTYPLVPRPPQTQAAHFKRPYRN